MLNNNSNKFYSKVTLLLQKAENINAESMTEDQIRNCLFSYCNDRNVVETVIRMISENTYILEDND